MVARGEIGLLIVQIGLNETPFLSEEAFVTATWATVLSTIIGPVVVGLLLKRHKYAISDDLQWGMQNTAQNPGWFSDEAILEEGRASRWASRRHSRAISRAASERSRSRAQSRAPSMDQRGANASGDRTPLSPRRGDGAGPDPEAIRKGLRDAGGSDGNLADEKGVLAPGGDRSDGADASQPTLTVDNGELTRRRVINFEDTPAAERKASVDVRGEAKDDTQSEKPDGGA